MEYRKLGNTDLLISPLGFGTMRLPFKDQINVTNSISLIQYAIRSGINFFDVGTFYCNFRCETIFGQAVRNLKNNIILCAKNSSHQTVNGNWTIQLQNSLVKLDIQELDMYFIHYLDYDVWENYFIREQHIDNIIKTKKEGLIRYLGFSSHDTPVNVRKLIDTELFDSVILSYNLLNRTYEDTIKYACEKGYGVIIMNPLAGGMLTTDNLYINELQSIFHYDPATIALKYVYSNPYVHCTLSGMQTIEEIDKNIKTAAIPHYSKEERDLIDRIITSERNKKLVYCTRCEYCLPCPQGIDIPGIIDIWNRYNIIRGAKHYFRDYRLLDVTADCCISCGLCEEKCPNGIKISALMKEIADFFA